MYLLIFHELSGPPSLLSSMDEVISNIKYYLSDVLFEGEDEELEGLFSLYEVQAEVPLTGTLKDLEAQYGLSS